MLKRALFTGLLLISVFKFTNAAESQWYWITVPTDPTSGYFIEEISPNTIGYTGAVSGSSGIRTIVPNGFIDVMNDTKDSKKCSGELDSAISQLRSFDSIRAIQPTGSMCRRECEPYYTQEIIIERESLLSRLKSSAEQCLEKEQQAIREAEEERKRKEAEEERLREVEKAVRNCDFNYFKNEMTDDERMRTYRERIACQESTSEPKLEPVTTYVPPVTQETYTPPQPLIPIMSNQIPEMASTVTEDGNVERSSNTPTSSDESLESDVEQQEAIDSDNPVTLVPESVPVPEPAPEQAQGKPSIFKRVINFFFGWLRY